MDESKLPQNPPVQQASGGHPHVPHHPTQQELATPPHSDVPHYASPLPGGFVPAEAWLSLVIGIIVLFTFPQFRQYLMAKAHGDPESFYSLYTITDANGSIRYEQSVFFFPQMGMTFFGVVMILDALVLLRPRFAALVWFTLVLTVLSVLLNVFAIVKAYDIGGFQLSNALAVAFGGYIALYDWRLLQTLRLS